MFTHRTAVVLQRINRFYALNLKELCRDTGKSLYDVLISLESISSALIVFFDIVYEQPHVDILTHEKRIILTLLYGVINGHEDSQQHKLLVFS